MTMHSLDDALANLDKAGDEAVLDFRAIRRVDTAALASLVKLAKLSAERPVRVVLQGVNVDVYKVLKLVRLAPCFTFTNNTN
jgi:anti-anti-sigma regulatory factor